MYKSVYNSGSKRLAFVKLNGWRNKAGSAPSTEDPGVTETVWPNLMRACRPNPDKRTDINVAFLNGSYTFGAGVRDQDTMVWKLNEKYPNVTFDNYAVPGYGPLQCANLLKEFVVTAKKYDLVCYNINDGNLFVNSYAHAASGHLNANKVYLINPYSSKDIFGVWHNYYNLNSPFPYHNRLLLSDLAQRLYLTEDNSYNYNRPNLHKTAKRVAAYNRQVREMERICRENGVDFAVCALEQKIFFDVFPNLSIKSPKVSLAFFELNQPEYRVRHHPSYHPNAIVHAYWAKRFSDWFDKEYLPGKLIK